MLQSVTQEPSPVADAIRIPFEESSSHVRAIYLRVVREGQVIVVDAGEEGGITLQPGEPEDAPVLPAGKTEAEYQAFLASLGSWRDVDTDRLLPDIRAGRS
jgi:hypothetical protein